MIRPASTNTPIKGEVGEEGEVEEAEEAEVHLRGKIKIELDHSSIVVCR